MATDTRAVFINLDQLTWSSDIVVTGGGLGSSDPSATPFLWVIWFKVDADGSTCFFTPGDHRDLGVVDVGPGAVISIPESLGNQSLSVTPIEFENKEFGFVGVVMVLMNDGGHVTAKGISAGHQALNVGVQNVIDSLLQEALGQQAAPSQSQIDQAVASANLSSKVSQAVQDAQSACENLWTVSGEDSEIGHVVATWSVEDFGSPSETKEIEIQIMASPWNIWTVGGSITVTAQCPATVSASVLANAFGDTTAEQGAERTRATVQPNMTTVLELMRSFRDRKSLLSQRPFNDWWNLVKRHTPELAYRLATRPQAQEALRPLIESLVAHLHDDNKTISADCIADCEKYLEAIQDGATESLRNDIRTILSLVRRLEHRTLHEALRIAATRHITPEKRKEPIR
jgi:hypothetical protein